MFNQPISDPGGQQKVKFINAYQYIKIQ